MYQSYTETPATEAVGGRVALLRQRLAKLRLDAFLVPRGDQHRGEYVAPSSERLKWLTAFSGSAGLAVVTRTAAALLVDGRYTVQAPAQTDTSIFEIYQTPAQKLSAWIIDNLKRGSTVGFDPWLHAIEEIDSLTKKLEAKGIKLKPVASNPIDEIWGKERPHPPAAPIVVHPMVNAGQSAEDKLAAIRRILSDDSQDAVILTAPESICWLFNLRGGDVAHTPVVLAFAIVSRRGKAVLFIDPARADTALTKHLKPMARLLAPEQLESELARLKDGGKTVRVAKATAAYWFKQHLAAAQITDGEDPCLKLKAIKNPAEIAGSRKAHARDAVAMCRFLAWFDREAATGDLDEITAAKQLEAFRAENGQLKEISFDTISGSGPNGAIVHYRVDVDSNRKINAGELFLVDSGAQYDDGTTDITRTIAVGTPSTEMRRAFTLVLKGHIAIATARFPKGTRGVDLDPFARHALWQHGLDFDHGTGHGVGSYLSVHEGPQSISRRGMVELEPGMIISNEPGYYREGEFGIRIENLLLVKAAEIPAGGTREMLSFETLTWAPIDRRLIDQNLLSHHELQWLNGYHGDVRDVVTEALEPADRRWLAAATAPLGA